MRFFKQQQEAAQKEKSIATKEAFIESGVSMEGAGFFGALNQYAGGIEKVRAAAIEKS